MVEFIVQNGGDIHIKTRGEEQSALHYAAKNDAVNSIQMLLGYGANIDSHDCRNRTPLQV
jgi:ankyrin repeat protein